MEQLRAEWAKRLRAARLASDLTQEELAEAAGISQVRLSSYELAVNVPRDEIRIALARALGLQVHDLFAYPDTLDEPNGDEEMAS